MSEADYMTDEEIKERLTAVGYIPNIYTDTGDYYAEKKMWLKHEKGWLAEDASFVFRLYTPFEWESGTVWLAKRKVWMKQDGDKLIQADRFDDDALLYWEADICMS